MDIQRVFEALGLSVTKDEGQIRNAYRKLLVGVNPEDDPEGFKRLREAYEEAITYAETPDEEEEGIQEADWMENGAVGEFLRRLADIYETFPRRLDAEEWKALLNDPILSSLDDGETAKWGLFSYLAENYRLPGRIYKLLDGAFFIEEDQEEFKEHLPENYVDYILYKIHEDERSDFPYELFWGAPNAEYDRFLSLYSELMNARDHSTREGLQELAGRLDELEATGIRHPWLSQERVLWLYHTGETEEAVSRMRKLLQEYGKDERICLSGAQLLQRAGYAEEARGYFEQYLEREDGTDYGCYRALYGLAELEADAENWEKAREYLTDAGKLQNTDESRELLKEVSGKLAEQYKERILELTTEEAQQFGWMCYEADMDSEGLAFFEEHPEHYEDTESCHKLMTLLYRATENMDGVLKEVKAWRQCLEQEEQFDLEIDACRAQYALTFYKEGEALHKLYQRALEGDQADSPQMQELYESILRVLNRAVELAPEDPDYRMERMLLYRTGKDYRKMVDECEEILEKNPRHFWACFYLQEAYEKLRMAQQVVNTFYRAKDIYSGHPVIYVRALEVFEAYDRYEDALDILHQAEEAGVDNYHPLVVGKLRVLYQLARDEESWQEAVRYAEAAKKRLLEEDAWEQLLHDAYMEMAYLYEDGLRYVGKESAEREERLSCCYDCVQDALKLQDSLRARYFMGKYYLVYRKEARKAYECLKACEERGMDFEWMYFYIARCHESFEEWNEAIEYYKKVVEKNPENKDTYWRIGWLYRRKFNRTEQREYAERALYYINLQDEKFGDRNQGHRWRGYIYMRLKEYDKALEEIEERLKNENDQDCGMWFLKAQILRYTRRYEEAITCYENSLHATDRYGEDDENCWRNIFQCFLRLKQYKECYTYFEKALEEDLDEECRDQCLSVLADVSAQAGWYDKAFYWQAKRYGRTTFASRICDSWKKEADRVEDVLDVWQQFQLPMTEKVWTRIRQAALLADQAYVDENEPAADRAIMCQNVGERFFYGGDYEKARVYFEKAEKLAEKAGDYNYTRALFGMLMRTCYWLGDMEQAKRYGDKYHKRLEKTYEECSDLQVPMEELMTKDVSSNALYRKFCWAFFTGRVEQAREYIRMMKEHGMCYWCDEDGCTELWESEGYLKFQEGDLEGAIQTFCTASRLCWLGGNKDSLMMLRRLGVTEQ